MPYRVLVVDDDADIRDSLADLLTLLPGCIVEVAGSRLDGTARAREGPWDLVLADERLRDGSGTDILAEVAAESPRAWRVVMSAGFGGDSPHWRWASAPVDAFLGKPWDPEQMLSWVATILETESLPPESQPAPGPWPRKRMAALS